MNGDTPDAAAELEAMTSTARVLLSLGPDEELTVTDRRGVVGTVNKRFVKAICNSFLATGQRHEDARDDAGDVAAEIAKILFTSGDGRTANRLIMEFETTIGGTGWSQRAVALKVAELLQASRQPAADPGQRLKDLRWAASDFRDSVDGRGGSAFAEHARARLDDELDIIGGN